MLLNKIADMRRSSLRPGEDDYPDKKVKMHKAIGSICIY